MEQKDKEQSLVHSAMSTSSVPSAFTGQAQSANGVLAGGSVPSLYAIHAALEGALHEWGRNVCSHEETKRGGAIWTICCMCGAKWADDEGGFQPFEEPARITTAYSVLSRVRAAIANAERSASGAFHSDAPTVNPARQEAEPDEQTPSRVSLQVSLPEGQDTSKGEQQ